VDATIETFCKEISDDCRPYVDTYTHSEDEQYTVNIVESIGVRFC
jgi:hypothetical protein